MCDLCIEIPLNPTNTSPLSTSQNFSYFSLFSFHRSILRVFCGGRSRLLCLARVPMLYTLYGLREPGLSDLFAIDGRDGDTGECALD